MATPPPPEPIDPEILADLLALSIEDHCRRLEHSIREVASLERLLGQARQSRSQVGRALAERLHRERSWHPLEVDQMTYVAHRDLRNVRRLKGGLDVPATVTTTAGEKGVTP